MAVNNDLQRFREEWHKELTTSTSRSGSSDGKTNTTTEVDDEVEESKHNQPLVPAQGKDQYRRYKKIEIEDTDVNDSIALNTQKCYAKAEYEDEESQSQSLSSLTGDGGKGKGKGTITAVNRTQQHTHQHDDADQYYPFKILTQFLNEAPRKVKPTRKRGADEHASVMTYSKKKYFDNLSRNVDMKISDGQVEKEKKSKDGEDKRMLDLFIADLDEINEIPFFDSSLPREVAFKVFQYFDMQTLCICSQVSRSWKSIADDDMLWCHICHKLGFDNSSKVFEDSDWKERVKHHVQQKKALEVNWKARVGKPYQLKFARGGVVCDVASHHSTIMAGYTSCQIKSWNTQSGDECTYNASNTSLVIDENAEDLGCIHNEIRHLSTTYNVTAASFRHGFVDIWKNDGDIDPIHTITFNNPDVSSLCTHDMGKGCSLVAASQNTRVQVTRTEDVAGKRLVDLDMKSPVHKMLWVSGCKDRASLLVSCQNSVWMKDFEVDSPVIDSVIAQDEFSMVEIHNMFYAPIACLGAREGHHEVGIGFNMITGPSSQPKLNVYDLTVRPPKASLSGHTWFISCMDMPPALPQQLATGSGDRKVRLFDLRAGTTPLTTLIGHSAKVTCIQMDEVKIVSGDEAGFVCVWDARTGRKLWDIHNRHPVQYCRFDGRLLIIGNIPYNKFPENERDEFESVSSLRYRGTVQFYDFLADQQTQGVPEICLSSYNEPEAFDYNLALAVPYDSL